MKLKVPKRIRVSSLWYDVVYVNHLEQDFKLLGQCLTDRGVLKIDCKQTSQSKDVTFLHELVHAIHDVYNCDFDEKDVDRLAQGLADVLKNSFGVEFIWEQDESQ